MKKLIFGFIAFTIAMCALDACTHYVTQTHEVIRFDTVPVVTETIKLVEVPGECKFDTSLIVPEYGWIDLSLANSQLTYNFRVIQAWRTPVKDITTTTTPMGVIRQQEKTKRNVTDETYKTSRDSMALVVKKLKDSISGLVQMNRQDNKTNRVDARQTARTEVAKTKGGIFARIKNALFWFVIGLITGSIVINILRARFGIVSNVIGKFIH